MKMTILINILIIMIGCKFDNSSSKIRKEIEIQKYITQNEKSYEDIYAELSEIINKMKKDSLKSALLNVIHESRIDRLLIFNKEKTKLFSTLNTSAHIYKHSSSDLVQALYGVKIKGKWHVYLGNQNLIAMRGGYKTNKFEPFTWEELSYVAHEQMFGSVLDFNKNGTYIESSDLIDKLVNPKDVCGRDYMNGTEEEGFTKCSLDRNAQKIDSLQYQELIDEINNPAPKEKQEIEKISWWERLWGAEVPIFETKEWKEYIKNKNVSK